MAVRKVIRKEGSLYPHKYFLGTGFGTEDLENKPVEDQYRIHVPKSEDLIKIGTREKLPHGTLKCFLRRGVAVVGLYQRGRTVGYELLYKPTPIERKHGIPEWKFDLQNTSVLGTDWDYQDVSTFFWTVRGLRKNGQAEKVIHQS